MTASQTYVVSLHAERCALNRFVVYAYMYVGYDKPHEGRLNLTMAKIQTPSHFSQGVHLGNISITVLRKIYKKD